VNLGQLVAIARSEADDTVAPYLWSDPEWFEFANDAQNEACRRARLLTDASTVAICQKAVTSGSPTITLDPRTIFVRRIKLDSQAQPLKSCDSRDLDLNVPSWESQQGEPRAWVRNWETGKVRLWPTPEVNDTMQLRVVRLPLSDMVTTGDTPEIGVSKHRSLVFWMLYRAFSKKDTQTQDDKRAAGYLALFEQEFGTKSSAIDETWINENHGEDSFEGLF
jgi:hypothetical protein